MSGYGFTSAGTTYDNEDRLTGFSRAATSGPALLSQSWSLTAVGDWTSVTTNGTAQSRTHGPTHELLTAGGQNVATDVKGNITTLPVNLRPAGSTTAMNLNWDSDNKLRSADIDANGTADVNFQYDALGRRVARSGTGGSVVFVQMDQQTIADYPVGGAATTPTFRYVFASYIDEPVVRKTAGTGGTLVYFHRNHQYSVTAVTTSAGAIAERYTYSAYGHPTVLDASGTVLQTSNFSLRYSFTGREWDATLGLYHFRARWMNPSAGRFLSRDPIGYGGGHSQYELFSSRALRKLDPTGKIAIDCFCHCFEGGSCGGREPLYPRYNVKFEVQIESSNYPNSTADSACSVACHEENDKRGNKPNNCVLESWNATGTTPYEPTASHCSIPDCIAGCSLAATSAFAICKTRAPLNVCVVLYGIAINSCSQSCVRRCDDRKSWILPEVLPDVFL